MSFGDGLNLFLLWLALFALVRLFETGDSQTDHGFDSIWAFLSFVARFYVLYVALALLWGAMLIYALGFALVVLIVVAFRLDRWLEQRKAVQHLNLLLQPTRLVEYGAVGMIIAFSHMHQVKEKKRQKAARVGRREDWIFVGNGMGDDVT